MKANRSLSLSNEITKQLRSDLSHVFEDIFPFDVVSALRPKNVRDRVFSPENTLLTMLLSMVQEDKSLQNALSIYSVIHDRSQKKIQQKYEEFAKNIKNNPVKKAGRPRKNPEWIAVSKQKPISMSTSAYTQARNRLPLDLVEAVFKSSIGKSGQIVWHNRPVFIADATYLQLQDTQAITDEFPKQKSNGFPRGLLSVITQQGNGFIHDYVVNSNKKSELELLSLMIPSLPSGSVLLADDLYSCFAILSLLRSQGVDIIVPCKRVRKYEVLKKYGKGDELIRIKKTSNSDWLNGKELEHTTLEMRRIEYSDPDSKSDTKQVLYTSITDQKISSQEIILKYRNRWDIEVSIREIKNIMDLKILRSKTPEMLKKELCVGLSAYNYIRKIILEIAEISDFPPEGCLIDEYYTLNQPILLDKLGRRYARWSPGRYGDNKK